MIVRDDNKPQGFSNATSRFIRWLWMGLVVLALVLAVTLLNNNFSFHRPSGGAVNAQLDHALDAAIHWIKDNPEISERNPSMMYMIADMERMSHDPRLQAVLEHYHKHYLAYPATPFDFAWLRLIDRKAEVPVIHVPDLHGELNEFAWGAYAVAPDKISLSPGDRANMFSPTRYIWGARQHQLLALVIYRDYNGSSPELDNTMNYLAEKIARDAHYDSRITDSYIQRTAFVLAAGRPDLIRRRWVERILDHQNADGSWNSCWYGWCRGIFEFRIVSGGDGHATVQAAWALTMLKYRYPQWMAADAHPDHFFDRSGSLCGVAERAGRGSGCFVGGSSARLWITASATKALPAAL